MLGDNGMLWEEFDCPESTGLSDRPVPTLVDLLRAALAGSGIN